MKHNNYLVAGSATLILATAALAQQSNKGSAVMPMDSRCQEMMRMQEKMQTQMRHDNEELDQLVVWMNQAGTDTKVDAMEAVLNKLADQRKSMNTKMDQMPRMMMGHMMQHLQSGKESMADCPLMKDMMKKAD